MTDSGRPTTIVKLNDEVIGREIKNKANEHLGKIKELVADKLSGKIRYAVLDAGSFLGIGGKYFALPWEILHFNADENCFHVDIDKDKLENAPGFDKDHWPDMADKTWSEKVAKYYGAPYGGV